MTYPVILFFYTVSIKVIDEVMHVISTAIQFPRLGQDWRIYAATSAAYCAAVIWILQDSLDWPGILIPFGSGLIHFTHLFAAYFAMDTIIILAGRWCNRVVILVLEWIAFTTVLPPVCVFLQDGIYLRGSIILFSRFGAVFAASLLAEKVSAMGRHKNLILAKQYYILAARILVPIIVLSAFTESVI